MSAATAYLEIKAVEAWLGERRVFEDLSLRLALGEHTVVLGPNGSGKSSLIRLLNRQIHPVVKPGSHLRLFGSERVNIWDLRARIGLFSEDVHAGTGGHVEASDVVLSGFFGSMGIGRSQQPSAGQRRRVQALMERLGLADLAQRRFRELSDGQRRRLLLARALVHDPEVLVLDEPTNGLDLRARHQLLALLRDLARGGTTLLLVTHRIDAVIPEISRALLLQRGRIVADGPVERLLTAGPLSDLFGTPLQLWQAGGYRQVLPADPSDGAADGPGRAVHG